MDDIYFGVLRVWHLLTSSKKVLVAIVGVVAVVATVTTVVAAPAHEEPDQVSSPVDATVSIESEVDEPVEALTIGNVDSPGLMPTSPFYPLKTVVREMSLAFTFDPVSKASRSLRYANEDLLAIYSLFGTSESHASGQCTDYQHNFWNSILWMAKAGTEGRDVQGTMADLKSAHDSHRLVLAEMLTSVNEANGSVSAWQGSNSSPLRDSIIEAASATSAGLEFAILALEGQTAATEFHVELQDDFSRADREIWLQIENRLGMPAEHAIALTESVGDGGGMGGAPIISRMDVGSFRLEPGETCDITCTATDVQGESVSYEWLAAKGDIQGEGSTVTWTAPDEEGEYKVKVVVSDTSGNQSSKSVTLVVREPAEDEPDVERAGPLEIGEMQVELVDTKSNLLKPPPFGGSAWIVFINREVRITCIVEGSAADLDYEWTCNVGELSEVDGDSVRWVPPGKPVRYGPDPGAVVSVTVTAPGGATAEDSVIFEVSTCSKCF